MTKAFVVYGYNSERQRRASIASAKLAELRNMDAQERQKRNRMPKLQFLDKSRRFSWESSLK